jgi:hypothetical protein
MHSALLSVVETKSIQYLLAVGVCAHRANLELTSSFQNGLPATHTCSAKGCVLYLVKIATPSLADGVEFASRACSA